MLRPELYAEFIAQKEKLRLLTQHVNSLKKEVTQSLTDALDESGQDEICINQRNSDKVLELKKVTRAPSMSWKFVKSMFTLWLDKNGRVDTANMKSFEDFVQSEREKRAKVAMVLSYRSRPKKRKRDTETPEKEVKVENEFNAQI